ncbi:hypothetical protein MP477_11200 [Chryseobacterium sp. WG23]|uniref:hypothetical protein n=1 Tax=Chryseobacterium sp. WG23 TaxID=2926910 RepID=UPI00211E64AF|nr:hypothetical protein [Chryseobacterium sp. WG23]MCQ9635524.1 hypothetical protein [Chryseobacterium sp. WG23]
MKYLPFEHIIYRTNLSEEEILAKISGFVEAKKFRFNNKPTKDFEGFSTDHSFEISRIIKGRNSFLPQISGVIQKNNYETQIEVKMTLHWFVSIFLLFWCGFVLLFFIAAFVTEEKISMNFFIPIFMLLFAYILTMCGFKSESKKSKEYLKRNFEAKIIKE